MNGSVDNSGNLDTNSNYGQFASAAGPNAAPGRTAASIPHRCRRCSISSTQPASAGRATRRISVTRTRAARRMPRRQRQSTAAAPVCVGGRRPGHDAAEPGLGQRHRSVRPQAFPVPVVRVDPAVRRLQLGPHRQPVLDPSDGLYHDLQSEIDDAGVQLDLAEQLLRRARRRLPRQQPVGRLLGPEHANAPTNYTGGLYAGDLFLQHVIPEIEASPAFKDGGLIDVTFDEAFPPFTYTGNSFANSKDQAPNYSDLAAGRLGRRDAVRQLRPLRADRSEHAAGDRRQRQRAVPRAGRQRRTSIGRPAASRRRCRLSRRAPVCSAGGSRLAPGARGLRRDGRRARARSRTRQSPTISASGNNGIQADDQDVR